MHQPPTKQEQAIPLHHHRYLLQGTPAVAGLEHKRTLTEYPNSGHFNRTADALEDVRFGLEEESEDGALATRGIYTGGVFPLGIMVEGGGDGGVRSSKVRESQMGERGGVKSFKLRGGGRDLKECGANLGNDNPSDGFKFDTKCEHGVEGQGGEDGGVTLYGLSEEIKDGGVKPFNELNREGEVVRFSQKFGYYGESKDKYEGYAQEFKKDPANSDRGMKLFAKNLYEHQRHGRVALPTIYGHEYEDRCKGGIKLPDAQDSGHRDREDGRANCLYGNPDKGITLPNGYEYDAQGQDEEGGGVNLFERYEGGDRGYGIGPCKKCQSQLEGQDLDGGGVCFFEDQDTEYGGVKLCNGPQSEDEVEGGVHIFAENSETGVGVVKISVEGECGDCRSGGNEYESYQHAQVQRPIRYEGGYHDNLELAQGTEDGDEGRHEGATFFQEDCDAKPSLAYLKLLAHFLV